MVQIKVGNIILDLYEFDPPKLNFAIEDITDTSARSEFTRTFRIPATPNNNEFFETAFEINGQDFDVTVKIQADLYVDGNLFREGELRLNNIYITRENEKIDYEVVFFGVSRNLWTAIGEGTLNQLNLSGYNHTLTTQQIVDSWQAYPEGGNTDGIFNGDIIYPLVDFGNTYDDNGDPQEGEISIITGTGLLPFTNSSATNRLERERFKPWIRAKVIWDTIFNEAGFTYTSNFLTSDTFRNLYVSAHGNTANIYTEFLGNTAFAGNVGESNSEEVDLVVGNDGYDYGGNIVNGRYVIPTTGSYEFSYQLIGDGLSSIDVNITLRLRNGTTTIDSVTQFITADPADPEFVFNLTGSFSDTFTAGDEINIQFSSNASLSYQGTLRVTDAPSDIVIQPLLAEDYKKLDFIRDIITKHRLVLAPDKNNSSNFIIEPWVNYIATGDLFDWTKKLDVSKDFKIQSLFYTQKSKIEYTDSEGGDVYNQIYLDQFEEVFGTLRVFSNNELLEGERQIKTQVIPLLVTQVRGAQAANNGMDNTIIPQLCIHEPEETGTQFIPIDSKNRYGYYNGLKDVNTSGFSAIDWYVEADAAGATGFTYYPMISPYNEFPVSASTIDFNWQREEGFIKYGLHNEFVGSSMYDVYWSSYINSLYDKWARRVTAYFVLNAEDLINFSYDDVIFIKDAYYYVEKIYDVPMGEKASVKVDLIKLLENTPRGGTPIGPTTPRALQYEVDTSLGDGTDTAYAPTLMYRNTALTAETTDAFYQIDWGDGNRELLYFNDSPSYVTVKQHTYSSSGTYIISILVNNNTPWRTFSLLGNPSFPPLQKVTRVVDWGNQLGQIASPFKISFSLQENFYGIPGDLDTTNIGTDGLEDAFTQTIFTGDCINFTALGEDISNLFDGSNFNQDISVWNVSGVTNMENMFAVTPFNQDITGWDVSNVTNMSSMFASATAFTQNISGWTTSACTDISNMFGNTQSFNQPLNSWDVSNVTFMNQTFFNGIFNQPLDNWNVSACTQMQQMFMFNSVFNQDLSNWDTSNVETMGQMFYSATTFNQSLADWDISSINTTSGLIKSFDGMLDYCGMSSVNYNATLIGWEAQGPPTGLTLGAQGLRYTLGGAAEAARTSLTTTYGWTINGDTGV